MNGQSEAQSESKEVNATMNITYKFPCLLTVERKHPVHRGTYKVSEFTVLLEDPGDVVFNGDTLYIRYLDDKQVIERYILRENFLDWRIRHYDTEVTATVETEKPTSD
jgi:hypothetical protein